MGETKLQSTIRNQKHEASAVVSAPNLRTKQHHGTSIWRKLLFLRQLLFFPLKYQELKHLLQTLQLMPISPVKITQEDEGSSLLVPLLLHAKLTWMCSLQASAFFPRSSECCGCCWANRSQENNFSAVGSSGDSIQSGLTPSSTYDTAAVLQMQFLAYTVKKLL